MSDTTILIVPGLREMARKPATDYGEWPQAEVIIHLLDRQAKTLE